jgi:hypothetical protein
MQPKSIKMFRKSFLFQTVGKAWEMKGGHALLDGVLEKGEEPVG